MLPVEEMTSAVRSSPLSWLELAFAPTVGVCIPFGRFTVQKWITDGLIGWATVAVLVIVVSAATRAPYSLFSTLVYSLFVGFIVGTPGGILLGRIRYGWMWSVAGGLLSAGIIGLMLWIFKVI